MAKLIYKFWGYPGYYNFVADIDGDTIKYKVKALNFGTNKEGTLLGNDVANFKKALAEAKIDNWESLYEPDYDEPKIMDIGHFSICYVNDDNDIDFTNGDEGCEPFEYHKMLEAISVADPDVCKLMLDKSLDE